MLQSNAPLNDLTFAEGLRKEWLEIDFRKVCQGKCATINNSFFTIECRITSGQCMLVVNTIVRPRFTETVHAQEVGISDRARKLSIIQYELTCSISKKVSLNFYNPQTNLQKTGYYD
jgi:hypothetical protein